MHQRGRVEQKDKAPEERKTPFGNSRTEASYTQNHVLGHPGGSSEQFVFTLFEKKDGNGRILPDMRGRYSEITPSFHCISTVL